MSKTFDDLLDELRMLSEDEYYTAAMQWHDADGNRGGKGRQRGTTKRSRTYPYDRDTSYGQPGAYDRGSSGAGPSHQPLTPHTSFTAWEEVDEAMGTPTNFGMSNRSSLGSTVPGMGGGWSHAPIKPWDDEDERKKRTDEGDLDIAQPPVEPVDNAESPYFGDMTDDDLETKIDRIWGGDDNTNFSMGPELPAFVAGRPQAFRTGLGTSFKTSRELSDIGWKESTARDILNPEENIWELVSKEVLGNIRK
jgi:hypothetical protein